MKGFFSKPIEKNIEINTTKAITEHCLTDYFTCRGRVYTNGAENTITMGLRNCKAEDEGRTHKNLYVVKLLNISTILPVFDWLEDSFF